MATLVTDTRPRMDWRTALMIVIVANMVCRVALIPYIAYESNWRFLFNIAFVGLIGPVFCMTDAGRQPGVRILLAAFAWMLLVCLLRFPTYRDPRILLPYLLMAIVSMLLMYPAAFVLGDVRGRRLFSLAANVYIAGITILAAVALIAAFSGVLLPSPGGVEYWGAGVEVFGREGRIHMFCNTIDGAVYCAIALMLVPLVWRDARGKPARAWLILAAAILFIALALSDARTPTWAFCACFGGAAYLAAHMRLHGKTRRELLRVCICVGVALAAAAACFLAARLFAKLLNPLLPHLNEARDPTYKMQTLTGRSEAWTACIRLLKENPSIRWVGAGPWQGISYATPYFRPGVEVLPHVHSILFQTAITFGLPGLVLFGAFAVYLLVHSVRLFFLAGEHCSYAERAMPLLLALTLMIDIAEIFLSFGSALDQSNPWFFLTAGYVVYLSTSRVPKRKSV